ncbi:MAG: hypothetical protein KatS3mg050_0058 [Litorilinea sp.]|nr:MAG: hypothetical protein KatS3mg050_0058 [Litorilinea sp.]
MPSPLLHIRLDSICRHICRRVGLRHIRLLRIHLLPLIIAIAAMVSLIRPTAGQELPPSPQFDLAQVPPPVDRPMARLGQTLYLESCAPCHGEQGNGDGPTAADLPTPPTRFADPQAIWSLSPAELFFTTKFGRIDKLMPPWENRLTDEQIWQVVAYAWSLHTSQAEVAAGAELYAQSCAQCHGEQGRGDGPQASVDLPDFADPAYAMARSQAEWLAGWQSAHPEVGAGWSQAQQQQVLEYIRTFSYGPAWESPYRPGPGAIQGQVVAGTPDLTLSPNLTVTLRAFLGFEPVATFTTTVDDQGRFAFSDLAVGPEVVYLASASTAGITYSSPVLALTEEQPAQETTITLYATTDDPTGVRIDRAHWIIDFQPGALLVGQLITFGSENNRTFLGRRVDGVDVPVTASLFVPPGAEEISLENGVLGGRFRQVGNQIYDTVPIVPGTGTRQLVLRYRLPYQGTSLTLPQEFAYPVTALNLLVADLPQLEVQVEGLTGVGSQEFQGRTYRMWQADNLPATRLELDFQGLLPPGAVDPRQPQGNTGMGPVGTVPVLAPWMPWATGGLVGILLAGVLLWSWRRGRLGAPPQPDELRQRQMALLQHIARLDDRYALGELDQQTWQQQRARLKAELLAVATALEQNSLPDHSTP